MKKLWEASKERKENSNMMNFLKFLEHEVQIKFDDYKSLHQFSIQEPGVFWTKLFKFFPIKYEGDLDPAFTDKDFLNYSWFPNLKICLAENLLNGFPRKKTDIALDFVHEKGTIKQLTYADVEQAVITLQSYLTEKIKFSKGDILAAYMPNIPQTILSMLATSGLGGVFTSTSSDFGVDGVIDRFGQVKPKVLVAAVGYTYGGKYFGQISKLQEIQKKLPSLEKIILVDFLKEEKWECWEGTVNWDDLLNSNEYKLADKIIFNKVKFKSPGYIMYSSGTTGSPKCIVHSVGGTLLQHVKELGLHTDLSSDKSIFYFTTCGWMMWNWLVSSLFFGSRVVLYEGSPAYRSLNEFLEKMKERSINLFGTSPKFLKAIEQSDVDFSQNYFKTVETIMSTGSPLLPEQYDFIYDYLKKDVLIASISGGTDIIGCFMLGNPLLPVYRGEIQCIGLGMDVVSTNEKGEEIIEQEGELVCRQIFPSMPIGFWNDSDRSKFKKAYFSKFKGKWHHGDFIRISKLGTIRVFGRSDATLNPGGVRIGTAEIYQQTEKLNYLEDCVCIGKQNNGDVDILLFVKMKEGEILNDEKEKEIKQIIRKNTTPRHVPKKIYQVHGIPYTRSGKKMEMLISKIINHRDVTNLEAVSNPECLEEFKTLKVSLL